MVADNGYAIAMNKYDSMLFAGDGIPVNKEEAAKYFKMGADAGDDGAASNFAFVASKGIGIEANNELAAKSYKISADKGDVDSMYQYALILEDSKSKINDIIKYCKMAVNNNNKEAIYKYACILDNNNNKEEAIKYYKLSANKQNCDTILRLTTIFHKGEGVPVNKEEAIKYYKMMENEDKDKWGYKVACFLFEGKEFPVDKEEAIKYYKMSADNYNINSIKIYAHMKEHGTEGVSINKNEAFKYIKNGAFVLDSDCLFKCGQMFEYGIRTPVDFKKAFEQYEKAYSYINYSKKVQERCDYMIENGIGLPVNEDELYQKLIYMHENGIGTPVNKSETFFYYVKLAKSKQSFELLDKYVEFS